jgi:alpha-glucosidase
VPGEWWRSGVVYQIYPRSFMDSGGDGVGDLRGITGRLDHLVALGVDALWLSPFYRSPMADFGYDIADHTDVDPVFGTLADADALIAGAHERGLRVIVDLVPNHTSDRHPWFTASRSSRDDPRRDWYVWRDAPPNDWRSEFGGGPAWTHDPPTDQWYLHSFLPEQPDLNWDHPDVEAAVFDVMRFWLRRGVDGFRIDVVHKLGKDPELGDDEPGRPHREDWPSVHPRLRRLRAVLEEFDGDRVAVGEVYLLDQRRLAAYVTGQDELHLAHNFVFLNLPWDAAAFRATIDEFEELVAEGGWPAWCLDNHDHSRTATRYGPARARVAAVLLLTLRGTPFLFQGAELGLPDGEVPPDRVVDVDGRDPERAPIPWEPGPHAGFTTGEPWLPLVEDADALCAARQRRDDGSALELTRRLARLRAATPALVTGDQLAVDLGPDVLAFQRTDGAERWLVAVNFAPDPVPLPAGEAAIASGPGRPGVLAGREAVLLRLS